MFKPQVIDKLTEIFPAQLGDLIPKYEDIPEEYIHSYGGSDHMKKMRRLFGDCFYYGLTELNLIPQEEIDKDIAWRHVRCVMASFEPKHEHKEAACVYMLSEWFKDATWKSKPRTW